MPHRTVLLLFFIVLITLSTRTRAQQTNDAPNHPQSAPLKQKAEELIEPPRYQLLRSEEDWSFLADERKRTDYLDSIKYIRLREDRDDLFLTIGGEARPFYENFRNENFGASPRDANGYFLQRYMLHANLRLGRGFRFFGELKSGLVTGRSGGARPPDRDRLDVNQAFVEFSFGFGKNAANSHGAEGAVAAPPKPAKFIVRAGRQELNYGSGRLVSVREGPNVRQAFDGGRVILNPEKFNVQAFVVKPVETSFGIFDDEVNSQTTFWGVYATRPLPKIFKLAKTGFDVYYLGIDRKQARFDQGAGREIRHTFGARIFNNQQNFDYDVEFAGQTGKFGAGKIRAAFFSANAGYTFKKNKLQPRIGFAGGINSGDREAGSSNLQTFSPPFPRGRYFGQIGANGPNNINGFSPSISLKPFQNVTVAADTYFFFRNSLNDGLYNVPGNLIRTSRTSRARFVGVQPQIEVIWQIDRHLSLTVNSAKFFIQKFIRQTDAQSRDTRYFAAWITYKF